MRFGLLLCGLVLPLMPAGCGPSPTGSDARVAADADAPADAPSVADGANGATFAQVYGIISANCAPCHIDYAFGGLDMATAPVAHRYLLRGRVVPGDPAMSRVICKLSGTACGARMPMGRAPLSDAQIAVVRSWIAGGARPD